MAVLRNRCTSDNILLTADAELGVSTQNRHRSVKTILKLHERVK